MKYLLCIAFACAGPLSAFADLSKSELGKLHLKCEADGDYGLISDGDHIELLAGDVSFTLKQSGKVESFIEVGENTYASGSQGELIAISFSTTAKAYEAIVTILDESLRGKCL